jgi:hypothetical protein
MWRPGGNGLTLQLLGGNSLTGQSSCCGLLTQTSIVPAEYELRAVVPILRPTILQGPTLMQQRERIVPFRVDLHARSMNELLLVVVP